MYGVISLMFWSITLVVSVKYVGIVMRADNEGEGGVMALIALVRRLLGEGRSSARAIVALGVLGASLFYGDSLITPAISVLSAVEGLQVAAPQLEHLVLPIACVILAVLFAGAALRHGARRGSVRTDHDRLVLRARPCRHRGHREASAGDPGLSPT